MAACKYPCMDVLRYTAFTTVPEGGNPAGVVLDARGADDAAMQRVAAEVGYSETAFLFPGAERAELLVRYFSPLAEVPFCGHATIASAVAYAERNGPGSLRYSTAAGPVAVRTSVAADGRVTATLVSVPPRTTEPAPGDLDELLAALRWSPDDLAPDLPPRVAFAGAWHAVLGAATRERLAALDYDFDRLGALMAARGWTTVALVHRSDEHTFHARNPFPPGGVVEDPATGAAAAALGGYLRELGWVTPPVALTVHQGDDMGRPSVLAVDVPAEPGSGIAVSGSAVALPAG
ncbi:PhzF family phenazine biosynthesis protein [Qaidamihabitans albus]|uniref:PhzF family phenazine biosynthesis protein n=1 Tax=Qaidamihabitans albus TaxID=2795733 RepID=UPI001F2F4886|nr:PhzF family phenazine biosynthesis isomerase [Qaidamihabitans albus]